MKFKRKQLKKHTKLILSGELTIVYAEHLKSVLKETLDQQDHVVLDLKQVEEMDLSALQLLCSAHRTALANGKTIHFVCQPPCELGQTLSLSGFVRDIGCDYKAEENCLWSGGDA